MVASFNRGLRGFARGYIASIEVCSGTKFFLPCSVSKSIIIVFKQFCSEANRRKGNIASTIYKVKQELNGGSVSNPLTPWMNYVKKGMPVETRDREEVKVKKVDINLKDLIFTENRDYLVKYNDDQKVKAEQLVGKAILLYFVPVRFRSCWLEKEYTTSLVYKYCNLPPNKKLEVIFVAVDDLCANYSSSDLQSDPQKKFEEIFSRMPWTAIPFSDIASRQHIARRFGISGGNLYGAASYFVNSKGAVLIRDACPLPFFTIYGTPGYPFTDKRIRDLKTLLGSPVRDYVISNKGDRVPIRTLKDKVVALYFYEDGLTEELTIELKIAYKDLAEHNIGFEVVLLYLYDTFDTFNKTTEESFRKIFNTMPWLALPYKDPNHKKLRRIFDYPDHLNGPKPVPTLVIIGPDCRFIDPCGAKILMQFGDTAYPYTRKRVAELETKKIKELKLNMLWDPNTVFRVKNDGSKVAKSKLEMLWDPITFVIAKHRLKFLQNYFTPLFEFMIPSLEVQFSQYAGKRLLIFFEMDKYYDNSLELSKMKEMYLQKKGLPWLVHYYDEGYSLPAELEASIFKIQYDHNRHGMHSCLLLAFERDGSIVRKTFFPKFDKRETFPFYAGGLEKEFLDQLNWVFSWSYLEYPTRKNQIHKRSQNA